MQSYETNLDVAANELNDLIGKCSGVGRCLHHLLAFGLLLPNRSHRDPLNLPLDPPRLIARIPQRRPVPVGASANGRDSREDVLGRIGGGVARRAEAVEVGGDCRGVYAICASVDRVSTGSEKHDVIEELEKVARGLMD